MFCHKCGTQIADGAAFCHKCGAKVVIGAENPHKPENDGFSRTRRNTDTAKSGQTSFADKVSISIGVLFLIALVVGCIYLWIRFLVVRFIFALLLLGIYGLVLNYASIRAYNKMDHRLLLPKGMDAQALTESLYGKFHYPYFKRARYDMNGYCFIEGKYASHVIAFNPDGTAILNYVDHNVRGPRKLVVRWETILIRDYINNFFDSHISPDVDGKFKQFKFLEIQCTIVIVADVMVSAIAIIAFAAMCFADETDIVEFFMPGIEVRDAYLTQYSDTVTIGDAFDHFFSDGKWSKYKEDDYSYVAFRGKCLYLGEKADVKITFQITGDNFRVNSLDINGVNQGYIMTWAFLSAVYGNN